VYPPFRGGGVLGQLRQEIRGVAAHSTKFRRDCRGNEADVGVSPHQRAPFPLRLDFRITPSLWTFGLLDPCG
jgi:hypothetical protein